MSRLRDAARELEVLEAAGDLAEGVRRDLAVLGGQQRGDLRAVRVDAVPDAEHDVGPLRERGRPPGREGCLRRGDRRVHLGDRGEVHVLGELAGRRVEHRAFATGRAGDEPATDPVADASRGPALGGGVGFCDLCHRIDLCVEVSRYSVTARAGVGWLVSTARATPDRAMRHRPAGRPCRPDRQGRHRAPGRGCGSSGPRGQRRSRWRSPPR